MNAAPRSSRVVTNRIERVGERVDHVEVLFAGQAEDELDALVLETGDEQLRDGALGVHVHAGSVTAARFSRRGEELAGHVQVPDVLPQVRKRVGGRVGGGARLLGRRGLQFGMPDAGRIPRGAVEHAQASRDRVLGPGGEPVVGHARNSAVAIAVGQRRSHRQAEPRPSRAERVGHDHRDRVGVPAGGPGVQLLDGRGPSTPCRSSSRLSSSTSRSASIVGSASATLR